MESSQGLSERRTRMIVALLSAVVFVAVVSGNMINVALPFIGRHFDVGKATYGWVVTGYVLTFGIFNSIHGRLGDVFGTRRLYLAGVTVFSLTAIAVTFSPTIGTAIGFRIFQGAGAAASPVLGTAIISKILPPQRRGAAMGVIIGTVGVAASIGPFLGGLLVEFFSWRAVFLFSAINLLAVPVGIRLLPRSLDETVPQRFDKVGATLLGVGAAVLIYDFNMLSSHGLGWEFASLLIVATVMLCLFVVWIRRAEQPFVQPDLFSDKRFVASLVTVSLINATRFGTVVLVPILLIDVEHTSAITVAAVLFPGALCIAFFSQPAGRWADRIGAQRPVLLGSLSILAGILVAAVCSGISIWGVGAGMTLYGLGFSLIQTPLTSATSQILPSSQTGVGLGMFLMIFFLGGAVGVALTLTLVEVQGQGATSWIGLSSGGGAPFSNAILCLLVFPLVSLALVRRLPGPAPKPQEVPAGRAAEMSGIW